MMVRTNDEDVRAGDLIGIDPETGMAVSLTAHVRAEAVVLARLEEPTRMTFEATVRDGIVTACRPVVPRV